MGFLAPFIVVLVVGGIAVWQLGRRRPEQEQEVASTSQVKSAAIQTHVAPQSEHIPEVEMAGSARPSAVAHTQEVPEQGMNEEYDTEVMDVDNAGEPAQDERNASAGLSANQPPADISPADKLDAIRGIGPVYAQRLTQAGIQSFAQLAELSPAQVSEIVSQGKGEQLINAQDWIEQAQTMSQA